MCAERGALDKCGCWEIVTITFGVKLVRSRYVYKLKKDGTGEIVEWKSRLVILGCNQFEGLDYGKKLLLWPRQQHLHLDKTNTGHEHSERLLLVAAKESVWS